MSELPDIELVSAKVHEAWMRSKRKQLVVSRTSEAGEELMVPYEKLSEDAKELDRSTVRAVYAAIAAAKSTIPPALDAAIQDELEHGPKDIMR